MDDILDIGIALSTEGNKDKLFDMILVKCMEITNCDGGILFTCEGEKLIFKNTCVLSLGIKKGRDGKKVDLPHIDLAGENSTRDVIAISALEGRTINIEDIYENDSYDFSLMKKLDKLGNYHTRSILVTPLKDNSDDVIGVLQLTNCLDADKNIIPFSNKFEHVVTALACQAAIAVANVYYIQEIKLMIRSFVQAMAVVVDERTPYNGSHTRKVVKYSNMIVEQINSDYAGGMTQEYFCETRRDNLLLAATLHDIGKMVVPLYVMNKSTRLGIKYREVVDRLEKIKLYLKIDMLEGRMGREAYQNEDVIIEEAIDFIERANSRGERLEESDRILSKIEKKIYVKPDGTEIAYLSPEEADCLRITYGTLTKEERAVMESHVDMTEKILANVHFDVRTRDVPKWAVSHHEMLDGSGYPKHLKGEQIDFEARILAVADIFDALTSKDRPYKSPMSVENAYKILDDMTREGKLDGYIVKCLKEANKLQE